MRTRDQRGVSGPETLGLFCKRVPGTLPVLVHRSHDLFGAVTDYDHGRCRKHAGAPDRLEDMPQHGSANDRMQNLMEGRSHPGA